jgi:hypothetical protein
VKASIEQLMNLAPPLVECHKDEATGGRAALKFYIYGKGELAKEQQARGLQANTKGERRGN